MDFHALTDLLAHERAARTRTLGNTPAGRRSLAAGLLLRAVFGESAEFETDAFGKPRLPGGLSFNLSHAGDHAVLATANGDVGVDIERRRDIDCMRIARRFFHPDEYAFLRAQADPAYAFFRIWTLKESYVKALGRGFGTAFSSFCVLPDDQSGAAFAGETPFCFRRYDDAFDGYCLSVCAKEDAFPDAIEQLSADDAR